jgi:hypothetical protein
MENKFRIIAIAVFVVGLLILPLQRSKRTGEGPYDPPYFPWWQRLFYCIMLLGMLGLAATGFSAGIGLGRPMEGWLLISHVMIAPAFAVGIAITALGFAERRARCACPPTSADIDCPQKFLFWLMLCLGLVAILSAIGPMLPIPDQPMMHTLYDVHRYSSLFFFAIAILHAKRFRSWRRS